MLLGKIIKLFEKKPPKKSYRTPERFAIRMSWYDESPFEPSSRHLERHGIVGDELFGEAETRWKMIDAARKDGLNALYPKKETIRYYR